MRSGNTYEREAIVAHLQRQRHPTDPLTNAPLANVYAIPNWQLRRDVQPNRATNTGDYKMTLSKEG